MLSEALPSFSGYNMTEKKEVQQDMQLTTEIIRQCITSLTNFMLRLYYLWFWLLEGLIGNQVREGSHPRRTFFLTMFG